MLTVNDRWLLTCLKEHYRFIARNAAGDLIVFQEKPTKTSTTWSNLKNRRKAGAECLLPLKNKRILLDIQWDQPESTEIRAILNQKQVVAKMHTLKAKHAVKTIITRDNNG